MKALRFSLLCPWLILIGISSPITSFTQNLRCKTISTNQQILLDTLPIEPGSIQVNVPYLWVDSTRLIEVKEKEPKVEVCYRVLSPLLTEPTQIRDMTIYDDSRKLSHALTAQPVVGKEEIFDFDGVQKYGAISRGISFGNRQSLFVNSTLNLQMDGKLDDNLFISAVITDQNIPYQPEGNTQQIRDFDNVFIKLYNSNFDVTAGDIVLQQPKEAGYFLKYYKNIQGLQASYRGTSGRWKYESRISGALSKGKFNSALIPAIDGLSGPYKLRGPNGERFIIVLANSEKVYIDGELMERGFDRDYVIDYNLGEITFNNHIIITQFTIIRVDYEYAEQFYSRSNLSAYQAVSNEKVKIFANYYRERDNPNGSLGFSVSDQDLIQLKSVGDSVDRAFITQFDSVRFVENQILYERKDTLDLNGNNTSIFVYSTNQEAQLFRPSFSDVGVGNGDYVLVQSTANGRIYEWISPIGESRQGNYQPGSFIPLPNSRQMINVGTEVTLSSHEVLNTEIAFSNTDENLYSNLQDDNNTSRGYYASLHSVGRPSVIKGYEWVASAAMEYDEADFSYINRYRPMLFDRNWNYVRTRLEKSPDLIFFLNGGVKKDEFNQVIFSINRRKRASFINGWQYQLDADQEWAYFRFISSHFLLSNNQEGADTYWLKSTSDLSYRKWKVAPGYIFKIDENEVSRGDSIASSLMNYRAHEWYFESVDSKKSTYRFSYQLRKDRLPVAGELKDYLQSKNLKASYAYNGNNGSLMADFNYREVEDRLQLNLGQDEVINGRINWIHRFFKNNLRSNVSFSTGNSRELRREFVYLPVSTGEGTHTWRDINGDGIQDLNEFFEAINPDERTYVKIFTPTDDYITSFQTFYLHTLDARFPSTWRLHGGMKSTLQKISANVNFNVNFKTTSHSYMDRLNPFAIDLDDDALVSAKDGKRYTLFFNRNGRGFAGDFTFQSSDDKQLLVQGYETREKDEWISNMKMDLSAEYTLRITTMLGNQLNQSDYLDSRNFEIITRSYQPQLIWQPTNVLRLIGSYERKTKRNDFLESSNEHAHSQVYRTELTWNQAGKGSLRCSFALVKIDFKGDPSSYLGYLLLDALQPGTNQTWQINWQQKISKGMQLSMLYNGRKSDGVSVIHTGTIQVTAYF